MSAGDERLRASIAAAAELALRDPEAAMRRLTEAAALGRDANAATLADGLEAMGRIATAAGDLATAREAFERAAHEATSTKDALVLARCRAGLATLARGRPYASSADALSAELRFAGDLLEAAHVSLAPAPHLHGARTRLELRRRIALDGRGRLPAIGRIENALRLGPTDTLVLAMCAALTVEPDLAPLLPPATLAAGAGWVDILTAWLSPAAASFDAREPVAAVLDRLEQRALIRRLDDGRPELARDVESLLGGRAHPALPEGCTPAMGTPMWYEGPMARAPAGPPALPHVLAIVGPAARCADHVAQLAAAHNWPTWIVRPASRASIRALAREALVHDRILGLALDPLDAALVDEAAALVDHLIILAPEPFALADAVIKAAHE